MRVLHTDINCDSCGSAFQPGRMAESRMVWDIRKAANAMGWRTRKPIATGILEDWCTECRAKTKRKRRVGNNGNTRAGASRKNNL